MWAAEFEVERGNYGRAQELLEESRRASAAAYVVARREAALKCATGDFAGAEKYALEGHHWDGRTVAKLRVDSPIGLNVLGDVLSRKGLRAEAIAVFEKSARQASNNWRMFAAEWAQAMAGLATTQVAAGDLSGAYANAAEALARAQKEWGPSGVRALDALDALGVVLAAQGQGDATQTLELCLRKRLSLYGPAHLKVADSFLHAAQALEARKESDRAIQFADRALELHKQILQPENARTACALIGVAEVYRAAGRIEESRGMVELARRILARSFGDDAPVIAELTRNLAQ